jgi:fatty acid desaturase
MAMAGSNASAALRPARVIDEAIHIIPSQWFKPSPRVYWTDLLISAAFGWTAFVLAVSERGWTRALLVALATAALYRAVLFIHEITHLTKRDVPAFDVVWNALVGVPLLLPSFLYENVHTDHHRLKSYGTEHDPEYLPFGKRSPALMAGCTAASLLLPMALVIRFGVLAPLSWLRPSWRPAILERASALVINHRYLRRTPIGASGHIQEVAAFALLWLAISLWSTGGLPTSAVVLWFVVGATASLMNAVRTLAAHRYEHDGGEVSMTDQLLDSCTLAPPEDLTGRLVRAAAEAGRMIMAPVGLRYHALHHWIPSLPYHNLGRVHRLLMAKLRPDAPYHATIERRISAAIRDLFRRARTASERWQS